MIDARRRLLGLALGLHATWCVHAPAGAQDAGSCEPPGDVGPLEVTPADGATSAPRDGVVRVRYSEAYFTAGAPPTETIVLTGPSGVVPGRLQLVGDDTLFFTPDAPLAPNTAYAGTASGGAFGFTFGFRTGSSNDTAAPSFGDPRNASGFRVDASPAADGCHEPGSRRIGLTFPSAFDGTSPATSIEYWVYVVRGEGLEAPRLVARLRDFGAELTTAGFVVGPELASGGLCVTVVAVDGLDRATEWPEPVCFDPQMGAGFAGLCSVSPSRASGRDAAFGTFAASLTLLARAARRRARS